MAADRQMTETIRQRRRNDLLPDLQIERLEIATLKPSRHRTRRTHAEQLGRLTTSIADLGFCGAILVKGLEIIDGHVRWEAAQALGLTHIPTIDCQHLTDTEIRKLALALNRTAELGSWDMDQLKIEFQELIDLDVDLTSTGFTLQEQDIILLDPADSQTEEEAEEDATGAPVSLPGDLWQLGHHRLICASALEPETYAQLLSGEGLAAIIADFPYNVRIGGNVSGLGKKKHGEFKMASGEMSDKEFAQFLETAIRCAKKHLMDGGILFGFMDWRSIDLLYSAGAASKLSLLNLIVWYKESGAMGGFYRSAHELIAVMCNGDTPRNNNVQLGKHGRDRTNVWSMPGANRPGSSAHEMLGQHATPKPVELCSDAILDVTNRNEAVLDPFMGSGTTLIAAEKTGRRCFGIELEPQFVDVSLRRWQRLTGQMPILITTGQTFDEVATIRAHEELIEGSSTAA
ncbi:DNA modification methylase [Aquisediminimonas sediminicola]|uniref:DNA modification methylase n=1 Tax=Alteraquisediminimonas sediminicola TaxID=2676787 RepID=UPI001C8DBC1A|nr:DNA modification methylase [Aquisediminimonas sediminicola]